jgi:16S rRNA (cytosine967-C5)-methyltransferase
MKYDPLRRIAWQILMEVDHGEAMEPLLNRAQNECTPDGRRLLAELVRGTLAMQGRYDFLIDTFSRGKTKARMRVLLRLGLHQLLACDSIPAYAAVNESVNLAKHVTQGAAGFANAVLAKAARLLSTEGLDGFQALFPDRDQDPAAHLAGWHSHPLWLVRRWVERFGVDATETLCRFNNTPALPVFHVLAPHDVNDVARRLQEAAVETSPGLLTDRALKPDQRHSRTRLSQLLADFPELIVQDEAVQAATGWLTGDVSGRVLDYCAAPGGKTAHVRARLGEDAHLVAMDLRPRRMRLVAETMQRTGLGGVSMLTADGLKPPLIAGSFAAVMLDGPCSGTGVIRHHQEGRWRLKPAVLADNAHRLLALSRQAVSLLAEHGWLLYSTCSLEPEENQAVVKRLLKEFPDLQLDAERQWLPQVEGADGFYAARLQRRS